MGATAKKAPNAPSPKDDAIVARALAQLREVIQARGLRHSSVREAIARAALEHQGHFEVGDLVHDLRRAGITDAHTTTVYRTIPILIEAGLISATLRSSSERQFFECTFERMPHDHLICTRCGAVIELEFEAFAALQRDLKERYGFHLESRVYELLGACQRCAASKATDSNEATDSSKATDSGDSSDP